MANQRVLVPLVCALLALAGTARAEDESAQKQSRSADITPYVFMGSNGASGVGAAVRWPLPAHFSVELETSYRLGQPSPLNTNVSVLFDLPDIGRVTPYVAGGVGLDQYAVVDTVPTGQVVAQAKTGFALNAGGGVRIRADEHWGIRSDARWINGVGARSPERWRLYNGVTFGGQE